MNDDTLKVLATFMCLKICYCYKGVTLEELRINVDDGENPIVQLRLCLMNILI